MFIGKHDFYTWFKTGLSLKLLRNILELFKKSSILLPSTKYFTIAILITNLFGKKHDVKRGKREIMGRAAKSVTSQSFWQCCGVTMGPEFEITL